MDIYGFMGFKGGVGQGEAKFKAAPAGVGGVETE